MICYSHALKRHGKERLYKTLRDEAAWKEIEVGTKEFWENLTAGKLIAHEDANGVYVGIVDEYDFALENGYIWIYMKPDPSQFSLPEGQDTLPVQFGVRDKIMMEIV